MRVWMRAFVWQAKPVSDKDLDDTYLSNTIVDI